LKGHKPVLDERAEDERVRASEAVCPCLRALRPSSLGAAASRSGSRSSRLRPARTAALCTAFCPPSLPPYKASGSPLASPVALPHPTWAQRHVVSTRSASPAPHAALLQLAKRVKGSAQSDEQAHTSHRAGGGSEREPCLCSPRPESHNTHLAVLSLAAHLLQATCFCFSFLLRGHRCRYIASLCESTAPRALSPSPLASPSAPLSSPGIS